MCSLKVAVECEELAGHAGPESVGALDRFLVKRLVIFHVLEVSAGGVLIVERLGDVESVDIVCLMNLGHAVSL